ncbi:hypothetical protein BJ980_001676 [Nocardioides daedukensis]|uniref:Bacterial EndoU nuclease domain-containing protein n=1 Tax=Nocardioides daedukensis TaxID=634462 RepID=A0A7Y9UNN9_9ACTN|nr:hypothetical protein [Nocardioides daedukensis]NYG58753.1 hypothetical protein [Nocardioides daedukensis]
MREVSLALCAWVPGLGAGCDAYDAKRSLDKDGLISLSFGAAMVGFIPFGDVLKVPKQFNNIADAAKSADEVADIGHAGLRHQFPNTLKGKSQFYDNVDLGGLASRTKGMDGFLQTNGNTRYVLRNPGGVGVDRTTGLPTDVFTVIRRPDGSVVTMFPGTSPKG